MAPKRAAKRDTAAAKKAKVERPQVNVGDKAPDVDLFDHTGENVNLSTLAGLVVLFAYPKANTPGCTRQTKAFGELFEELNTLGVKVFGLSADSQATQASFCKKLGLQFPLLSDPDLQLLEALHAKKTPSGIIRSHFVLKDGVFDLVEYQVKPDQSAKIVLQHVQGLLGDNNDADKEEQDAEPHAEDDAPGAPVKSDTDKTEDEPSAQPSPVSITYICGPSLDDAASANGHAATDPHKDAGEVHVPASVGAPVALEPEDGAVESTVEPVAEPVVESTVDSVVESAIVEPVAEGTVEPAAEGTVEPVAEGTVEPVAEGTVEPVANPLPAPVPAQTAEPETKPSV